MLTLTVFAIEHIFEFLDTLLHSVMQSDGNSFGDEENILDQIYESKYVRIR